MPRTETEAVMDEAKAVAAMEATLASLCTWRWLTCVWAAGTRRHNGV